MALPLGAGLLDVAAGISLLAGMRGNRADAGNQRAVPCDIEEAGTKGPGAYKRRASFRASTPPPSDEILRFLIPIAIRLYNNFILYLTITC